MMQIARPRFSLTSSRPAGLRPRRYIAVQVNNKLVLTPVGDGDSSHIKMGSVGVTGAIDLSLGVFEVGREPPADITLAIPTVSGRHAMLTVNEDQTLTVTDLGSTNGTFVNDQKLKELQSSILSAGDQVTFGDPHLAAFRVDVVSEEEAAAAAAAEQPAAE